MHSRETIEALKTRNEAIIEKMLRKGMTKQAARLTLKVKVYKKMLSYLDGGPAPTQEDYSLVYDEVLAYDRTHNPD